MKPAPYPVAAGWRIGATEILADTDHLRLERTIFASPMRPEGRPWLVVRRKAAVVVVPQRTDGHFLFIRQERPPVCRLLWEFPAGQVEEEISAGTTVEKHDEILARAALRELEEETGHTTSKPLEPIGSYYSSPGFTDEQQTIFLARDVQPLPGVNDLGESSEAIAGVEFLTAEEVWRKIRSGNLVDANSLAAWSFLLARGHLPG